MARVMEALPRGAWLDTAPAAIKRDVVFSASLYVAGCALRGSITLASVEEDRNMAGVLGLSG